MNGTTHLILSIGNGVALIHGSLQLFGDLFAILGEHQQYALALGLARRPCALAQFGGAFSPAFGVSHVPAPCTKKYDWTTHRENVRRCFAVAAVLDRPF